MPRGRCAIGVTLLILVSMMVASCTDHRQPFVNAEKCAHEDGTYRGSFIDQGLVQVNVQFTLKDGIVTAASFRHLQGVEPVYNLTAEEEPYKSVIQQYEEALQYLVGKPLSDHLVHLYQPEGLVTTQVDGYTGATIRSVKIISAIRDALSRGVYSYPDR